MSRLFASPVQGRVQRELQLLDLRRGGNHHASLDASGVMTIGQGGGAIGWRIGERRLLRGKNRARSLHGGLKAGGAEGHGGLGVSKQFVGCGQFLLRPQTSAPFETLTVFKFLNAREMFCDCRRELLTPAMGGLKLQLEMVAFRHKPLRQFQMIIAILQRRLHALAKIMVLQLKAVDPRLQRSLFQPLLIEGLSQLLLDMDQGVQFNANGAQARRHILHIGLHRAMLGPCMAHLGVLRAHGRFDVRKILLERSDHRGATTNLAHMTGAILRHHFDFSLKAPLLDGRLRAQLIALGEDLRHGQGHEHFETAFGQAHGPPPEGWQDQEGEESAEQEPQREYHGLFDQGDNRMSISSR